jgi:hypothetical protein
MRAIRLPLALVALACAFQVDAAQTQGAEDPGERDPGRTPEPTWQIQPADRDGVWLETEMRRATYDAVVVSRDGDYGLTSIVDARVESSTTQLRMSRNGSSFWKQSIEGFPFALAVSDAGRCFVLRGTRSPSSPRSDDASPARLVLEHIDRDGTRRECASWPDVAIRCVGFTWADPGRGRGTLLFVLADNSNHETWIFADEASGEITDTLAAESHVTTRVRQRSFHAGSHPRRTLTYAGLDQQSGLWLVVVQQDWPTAPCIAFALQASSGELMTVAERSWYSVAPLRAEWPTAGGPKLVFADRERQAKFELSIGSTYSSPDQPLYEWLETPLKPKPLQRSRDR